MSITKEGLFRYKVLNEHQRKGLLLLDAIRKKGPISKADLAKQLGYNIVTLSNYVDEYLKKGIIRHEGVDASSGGRRPVLIDLNKNGIFLIGVDFNKEQLTGVITDFDLNIISEAKLQRPDIEQEEIHKALVLLVKELINKSGIDSSKIKFIAIGTYGMLGEKNGTVKALDEEKGRLRATIYFTALRRALEKEFGIETFFGQDASFAAFGERVKNPNADAESMLYIFRDIGKGVVIKGEVYCSTDIGSTDIEGLTGVLSEEEKARILEDSLYLKPWNLKMSLKKEALRVIESGVGTKIVEILNGDLSALTDEAIIKAAQDKDEVAQELIQGIGINLGVRIAYLINLFSPKAVIIGGGIEMAGDFLFDQIYKTVEKLSLKKPRQAVKVLPAVLGDKAVSLGAACVAQREIFLEA